MKKKIAINGFGRIGRIAYRQLLGSSEYKVVAINSHGTIKDAAYLLKYDSTFHTLDADIKEVEDGIIVDTQYTKVYQITDPKDFPWKELEIDVVLECTGKYTNEEDANKHIEAGAKHVIISAPGKGNIKTIVYGVNEELLTKEDKIISAASCTTNCVAPVLKLIEDNIGIESGFMTTIHAYTNDQNTLDGSHKKGITSRRGRTGSANIIPTSTGAGKAVGLVIPSLQGKIDGVAYRVPVPDGSLAELTLTLKRETTIEEINNLFINNQNDIINYTQDPVVSSDIIGSTCGGLVDGLSTKVLDTNKKQIKVVAWYDNENGYTAQMIKVLDKLMKLWKQ